MTRAQRPLGIFLVSLGAKVMTPDYFRLVSSAAPMVCETLTVVLLDEPERINLSCLNHLTPDETSQHVERRCAEIVAAFPSPAPDFMEIRRWSQYESMLVPLNIALTDLFQVFKNLQPLLRRHSVTSKRHEVTRCLAPYLLKEISLLLFFGRLNRPVIEIAPEGEMDIVREIYAGKFPELEFLVGRQLERKIIDARGA
jgi:hypothetical protein